MTPLLLSAQMRWNAQYQAYINQYRNLAIEQMLRYRIPASITLAQGLLESGAGMSDLTRKGNNHFGIKCHGWQGRATYHDDDERQECFRAYDNAFQSYEDHSKFLASSQRYGSLFRLSVTDYKGWARGLKQAGYATSPTYASKLIGIIELYKLYQYDTAKSFDKFLVSVTAKAKPLRTGGTLHEIHLLNKNYYVIARQGDTFESIGKEIGVSASKIAKANERKKRDKLQTGEIVYLKKKQKRADKQYKNRRHIVHPGESMYSISQTYGIRLKSLYKMNALSPDYQLRIGDSLRLR